MKPYSSRMQEDGVRAGVTLIEFQELIREKYINGKQQC